MPEKGWTRLLAAGAALLVAMAVVACSDDGDAEDAGTGGTSTVAPAASGEATATPNDADGSLGAPSGGQSGGGVTGSTGGAGSPPSAPAFEEPPTTTATANGESVETGIGTYCWTMMCVDKIGVPTKGSLTVSPGDTVVVAVPVSAPALREAVATVFPAVNAQRLDDGSDIWPYPGAPGDVVGSQVVGENVEVTVDLAPGRYVLAMGLYFEAGDVVYGVLLEVR